MPKAEAKTETKPKGWAFVFTIGSGMAGKAHYFIDNRSLCSKYMWLGSDEALEDDNHNSSDNCAACRKKLLKSQGKDPDEMDLEFKPLTIQVLDGRSHYGQESYLDLVLNREKTYFYRPPKKIKDSENRCTILGMRRKKGRNGLMVSHVRVQWEGTKRKKVVLAGHLRDLPGKLHLKLAGVELPGEERNRLKRICHVKAFESQKHVRGEDGKVYEIESYTPGAAPVTITIEGKPEAVAWFK
jgi:hypothetical protein